MTEDAIQKSIVRYLRAVLPSDVLFYHPVNGGKRSKKAGQQFKNMGVLPGVPDLCFVLADGMAAFMEVKQPSGDIYDNQIEFADIVKWNGCRHAFVRSVKDAETIIKAWGVI